MPLLRSRRILSLAMLRAEEEVKDDYTDDQGDDTAVQDPRACRHVQQRLARRRGGGSGFQVHFPCHLQLVLHFFLSNPTSLVKVTEFHAASYILVHVPACLVSFYSASPGEQ